MHFKVISISGLISEKCFISFTISASRLLELFKNFRLAGRFSKSLSASIIVPFTAAVGFISPILPYWHVIVYALPSLPLVILKSLTEEIAANASPLKPKVAAE